MAAKPSVEPFVGIGCQELMADGCSHSGIVEKETSLRFTTYNVQRYMVLKSGCLYCFGNHNDSRASAQFSLSGYRLSNAPEKRGHAFKLIDRDPKKKTLVFTVASAREKDEWMSKIQEDYMEYCHAEDDPASIYEEAVPEDNLYLDPGSRPPPPLPEERPRKSQSLYIPHKSKTFSSAPEDEVAKEWPPLPPLPSEAQNNEPELPPALPRRSSSKPAPPQPNPRPQPKPKPKPRGISDPFRDRPVPPRPTEQLTGAGSTLRRYTSEPQLDPRKLLAGAITQEFKNTMQNLEPIPAEKARNDIQEHPQVPARSGRPGNRDVKKRTGPDGDSFRKKDSASVVEPSLPNSLSQDVTSGAPKKMDMQAAGKFLHGSKPGAFVLRPSGSSESGKAISVWIGDKVKHYRVFYKQETGYALSHDGPEFDTIKELIKHYRSHTLPNT